jgi:hypothetical protein
MTGGEAGMRGRCVCWGEVMQKGGVWGGDAGMQGRGVGFEEAD